MNSEEIHKEVKAFYDRAMTAPTYPRIHEQDRRIILDGPDTSFLCVSPWDATLALRALQDAFAAGQRSMIERKDDDRTDA